MSKLLIGPFLTNAVLGFLFAFWSTFVGRFGNIRRTFNERMLVQSQNCLFGPFTTPQAFDSSKLQKISRESRYCTFLVTKSEFFFRGLLSTHTILSSFISSLFRCFKRALEIDGSNSSLWEEVCPVTILLLLWLFSKRKTYRENALSQLSGKINHFFPLFCCSMGHSVMYYMPMYPGS